MTTAARLTATRALLDTPPPRPVPGQLAIPDAALAVIEAVIEAAIEDGRDLHETTHERAHRVATYLASSGWTITPTT